MASQPEREPEQSGASDVPVQPLEGSVPEEWLADSGGLDLADNVDRLAGDVNLVMDLALAKFEGPLWDYFSNELAKYGVAVIGSWIGRGLIYERCKHKGLGGLAPLERAFTKDEKEELTGETVAKALAHFRADVLMKRKWDSSRGATLRTYFIGQCLIRFANIYRRWRAGENRNRYSLTDDAEVLDLLGGSTKGPEDRVVAGLISEAAMSAVKNPTVRRAMHMTAEGWSQADIGEFLGVTEKAVERMLANERVRLRRRGIA